jgi:hypothetical protein
VTGASSSVEVSSAAFAFASSSAFSFSSSTIGLFFGSAFTLFPSITPLVIKKLWTVSETCAPFTISSFTLSSLTFDSFLSRASYDPRIYKNLPLLGPFFESVKTIRNVGSFFFPTLCNLIINMGKIVANVLRTVNRN